MTGLEDQLHYEGVEQKVVGGLGVDPTLIPKVAQFLKPDMFSNKKLGKIFAMCIRLWGDKSSVDEMTLTHLARKNPAYGVEMMDIMSAFKYASPMDVDMYAKGVAERWIKDRVRKIAQDAINMSSREAVDAFELMSTMLTQIEGINEGIEVGEVSQSLASLIEEAADFLEEAAKGISGGVPSGLTEVDELTNGWQKGDLIIIAARPAMGKSAFVTTMMKNAAHAGFPSAISSLEMTKFQVTCRLVAEDVQLFISDLAQRRLTPAQAEYFRQASEILKDLVIIIDDNSKMHIKDLEQKVREWKRKYDIQLLVVDYLQLMSGDSSNREQEIGEISRGLKRIAKDNDIPVIALSQLNRGVETRENKRPMMSDLRESGSIEQDADAVFFLYRPEYYAQIAGEECPPELRGVCQLITGKFRNGTGSDIILKFVGGYSTFKDRDDLNVNLNE